MCETMNEPTTTDEIEAFIRGKVEAGEADTGLYDTGLAHVVVDVVEGQVTFQWFRHATPLSDLVNA